MQFPSMVELAQELSARGNYTSAQILTQLLKSHDDLQTENEALRDIADKLATLLTENAALKLQAANANLHSLHITPVDQQPLIDQMMMQIVSLVSDYKARPDHMAHLCALAHSAVSLMILPPFARDAHKLRADGTLEPQTKDTP